jgi:hypothetical protein
LHRYVGRNKVALDQIAAEVEVCLRSGGKADFDFLEPDLDQFQKHPAFAGGIHGFDQGLVAIAQIHAAPDGRLQDGAGWPLAVYQRNRLECSIFPGRVGQHTIPRIWSN